MASDGGATSSLDDGDLRCLRTVEAGGPVNDLDKMGDALFCQGACSMCCAEGDGAVYGIRSRSSKNHIVEALVDSDESLDMVSCYSMQLRHLYKYIYIYIYVCI